MHPTRPRLRAFRWILRLYPRDYRDRYAQEMEAFFLEERRASGGGMGFWLGLAADHLEASWGVRRGTRKGRTGTMGRMGEDFWFAARALRRAPAFTVFAVVTLSLGIGATTAVFSVLDHVVLRPLPYPQSARLALVGIDARHNPGSLGPLSASLLQRLQEAPGPAEAVVAASGAGAVLVDGSDPERTRVTRVSRGFFPFFGARPAVGRLLIMADHNPGAPGVVVLGHEFWGSRYGSDPEMVGRSLRLDGEVFTVVGVLSDDFVPPHHVADDRDLWIPLHPSVGEVKRGTFFLAGVARLRPEASLAEFDAHVDQTVAADMFDREDSDFLLGGTVRNYRDSVVGATARTLGRTMAAVALLLLIACVNVASLLLTRGAQRAHELAVRAALGAGRKRMIRQLLSESLLIAVAGGVLGSGLAWGGVEIFRAYAPPSLPRLEEVGVDLAGLGFSVALGMGTVLLFGLLPALRSSGAAARGGETLSRRATAGRREGRLLGTLIAAETALAVVLTVGSALLSHDLLRLSREDTGFRSEGLVAMRLDLTPRFERDEWVGVWERLVESARALPGVTAAAVATQAPYAGMRMASRYRPEGSEAEDGEFVIQVTIGGDYLRTLGARLVAGRGFAAEDDGGAPVLLVNEAFVAQHWPGESGVGKQVRGEGGDADEYTYEVVGVLADIRTRPGRETPPHVFLPLAESPLRDMEVILRTDGEAAGLVPAMRGLVRRLDPGLAVTRIATVEGLATNGLSRTRFYTALFGGFAALALLLAVVGVYGTTAYATRARFREIGIRLALGAHQGRLVGSVVARTAAVVGVGVVAGLVGAAAGGRVLGSVLVYVTPRDGLAYGAVALVVMAAGVAAAWIPAGRAGRVDPASILREEG